MSSIFLLLFSTLLPPCLWLCKFRTRGAQCATQSTNCVTGCSRKVPSLLVKKEKQNAFGKFTLGAPKDIFTKRRFQSTASSVIFRVRGLAMDRTPGIKLKTSPQKNMDGEVGIYIHSLIAFIEPRIIYYGVIKRLSDSPSPNIAIFFTSRLSI